MKNKPIKKELLFIHHTSLNPNKCVHAIVDNTTNVIYPQNLLDTTILSVIGLTNDDLKLCKEFFDPEFK